MKRPVRLAAVIGAASVLWLLNASLYIVGEGQEALVVRLGKPMGLAGDPGLKAKMPLVDTVNYYETRLLLLEPPAEQVILGDQKRL